MSVDEIYEKARQPTGQTGHWKWPMLFSGCTHLIIAATSGGSEPGFAEGTKPHEQRGGIGAERPHFAPASGGPATSAHEATRRQQARGQRASQGGLQRLLVDR